MAVTPGELGAKKEWLLATHVSTCSGACAGRTRLPGAGCGARPSRLQARRPRGSSGPAPQPGLGMGCRGPRSVHTHSWGTVVLPPLAAFFSPQTRAGGSGVKGALPQGALWPRPHAAPHPPVPSVARGLSLERRGETSQGACALAPACLGSTAPRGPPTPRHATPRVANTAAAHSPCSAGLPVPRGPHGVLCREEGRRPFVVVMGQKGLQAWGRATGDTATGSLGVSTPR